MTNTTNTDRLERETCSRCQGTGSYSYCQRLGHLCAKCFGRKEVLTARGAEAARYLEELRSKPASDLLPGDRIRVSVMTADCSVGRAWGTVVSVTGTDRLTIITTGGAGALHQSGIRATERFEIAQTAEQKAQTLAMALAYQATLTKAGKPRKRAA